MPTDLLADYERHLRLERGRSEHTVRGYLADARSALDFALARGHDRPESIDLADLRSWLAASADSGAARASLARRSAAARAFFGWAHRVGHLEVDPSTRLAAPKRQRTLPHVLRAEDVRRMLDGPTDTQPEGPDADLAGATGPGADPVALAVGLRDHAIVEILYATAMRVGEIVG
ncbi:MAG: site-specific integrase, partial [Micrococcales bacterium]|nr:site-specific integrase [Micrococcales bacterium]